MAITIPQAAQVVCSGQMLGTETWANVFHVSIGVGPFGTSDADAIQARFLAYYNGIKGNRTTQWSLTQISVRDIRTEANETFQYTITTVVGTASGVPMPPQCSLVVTLRSATNSRRGRGRVYLNGLIAALVGSSDAQVTNTNLNNEGAAFATLGQNLLADGYNLAVASRASSQLFGVEEISIDSVIDTQRRRAQQLVPVRKYVGGITGPP